MNGANTKRVWENAKDICGVLYMTDANGNQCVFELHDGTKVTFGNPLLRDRWITLFEKVTNQI